MSKNQHGLCDKQMLDTKLSYSTKDKFGSLESLNKKDTDSLEKSPDVSKTKYLGTTENMEE